MNFWLVKEGEHVPIMRNARPMRYWLLADELARRGHSVTFWASSFSHQKKALLSSTDLEEFVDNKIGVRLLHVGAYKKNFSVGRYLHHERLGRRLLAAMKAHSPPDLILCASPPIQVADAVSRFSRQQTIPYVIDIQDLWPDSIWRQFPMMMSEIVRLLLNFDRHRLRSALRNATGIVAVSEGFLQWATGLAQRGRGHSDRVFNLGYPSSNSQIMVRSANETKETTRFVFVGSFGRSYELQLVCDVAADIYQSGRRDIEFVIAGMGEQEPALRARASSLPNLKLAGWLEEPAINQLLRNADVGLVPCRSMPDTMPNKPFEYFSAGLPVISSLQGEMSTLIGHLGLGINYDCGDASALFHAIVKLADDRALRFTYSSNVRRAFTEYFSAEIVYSKFADYLEQFVSR